MTDHRVLSYEGYARKLPYYDLCDTDEFICRCGWRGTAAGCDTELFREVVEGACPICDTMLWVRSLPTTKEVKRAAKSGNPEALEELAVVREVERRRAKAKRLALTADSPLPPVADGPADFIWDFENELNGKGDKVESWTVIRVRDQVIWRELAYWEGQTRFMEVRDILASRYGSTFARLVPTPGSRLYLYGDERPWIDEELGRE